MIPLEHIAAWRPKAPWLRNFQVEHDLIISRAIVAIFSQPVLARSVAFRGGTALHKLYFRSDRRYSEDIDLVQIRSEPAGPMMSGLREALDPWLGKPAWKQTFGRITFVYRFVSSDLPALRLKLKVETNTREHSPVFGLKTIPFSIDSGWFQGQCDIVTFSLDELLGTKLRALYQRKKARDLYDLATALRITDADPARIVTTFAKYMSDEGHHVTRAMFEQNLAVKKQDSRFGGDLEAVLAAGQQWDIDVAMRSVLEQIVTRLPGEPWSGELPPDSSLQPLSGHRSN